MTNIWGLEKQIEKVKRDLREENLKPYKRKDLTFIKNCQKRIKHLKKEIEKIRRQREKDGKRKRR